MIPLIVLLLVKKDILLICHSEDLKILANYILFSGWCKEINKLKNLLSYKATSVTNIKFAFVMPCQFKRKVKFSKALWYMVHINVCVLKFLSKEVL